MRKNSHLTYEALAKELAATKEAVRHQFRKLHIPKIKASHTIYTVKEDYFTTWSSGMAYVLGFIFADGNIRPKERTRVLRINNSDYNLLLKIRKLMDSNQPIYVDKRTNTDLEKQ